MQNLNNAKVEGNRIDVGDYFIQCLPLPIDNDLTFLVKNKVNGSHWYYDTLEEALEAIK